MRVTRRLRWFGSQHGSSSCQWGRPGAQWGQDQLKLLRLWWGSTCHLHQAGTPQLREKWEDELGPRGIRFIESHFNNKKIISLISECVYLLQTVLQRGRRAAPAAGRCWWTNFELHQEFALHDTCTSTPGCLAGSPDCHYWLRRDLWPRAEQGTKRQERRLWCLKR